MMASSTTTPQQWANCCRPWCVLICLLRRGNMSIVIVDMWVVSFGTGTGCPPQHCTFFCKAKFEDMLQSLKELLCKDHKDSEAPSQTLNTYSTIYTIFLFCLIFLFCSMQFLDVLVNRDMLKLKEIKYNLTDIKRTCNLKDISYD